METLQNWVNSLFTTDIYGGQSLSDYLTVDALIALAGSVVAALVILIAGFAIAGLSGVRSRNLAIRTPRSTTRCSRS